MRLTSPAGFRHWAFFAELTRSHRPRPSSCVNASAAADSIHGMAIHHFRESHPDIIKRLRRAAGHLDTIITMIENERPCLDLAQQLHAVERAIANAKKALIHDHIDNCLDASIQADGPAARRSLNEFKEITKYL